MQQQPPFEFGFDSYRSLPDDLNILLVEDFNDKF